MFISPRSLSRHAGALTQAAPIGTLPLAMPRVPSGHIEVFHSLDEAEAVWRGAQDHCACYGFQTFEWLSAWQQTIGAAKNIKPCIVHIADIRGSTLMLLPLGIERRLGLAILHFLGDPVTDYHAPLINAEFATNLDGVALEELFARVITKLPQIDVIAFDKIPDTIEGLANPFARLSGAQHRHNAYAAGLAESFAEFKKCRRLKLFNDTARQWRRLAKIAPTAFCIAQSPEAAGEIVHALSRQKRNFCRDIGAPDFFALPGHLSFYATLAAKHQGSGLIQTAALRVGEKIVATHWGMVFRNRFYWLMPAYERGEFACFSPGRLLMQSLMEWSIAQGLKVFDLTIGGETYKHAWADQKLQLYSFMRAVTLKGEIYRLVRLALLGAEQTAKQSKWLHSLVRGFRRLRYRK